MKRLLTIILSFMLTTGITPSISSAANENKLNGWLMWHSYTDYFALDSRLYVKDPDGAITELTGDFKHAMNGDFGNTPEDIVFMAIDNSIDEWDIYLYRSGVITNLTPNSGFRNEDPKFSPDGKNITFKRGFWSKEENDFVYNLAILEPESGEVTILTDDVYEEAMPYYSNDGKYIYYTDYTNNPGSICKLNLDDKSTETVYAEANVCAYYPIISDQTLYFAKWYSAENHTDMIIRYDGEEFTEMPFNSAEYNCSDPCPIDENKMIYSGTQNGNYDLYYFDGEKSLPLDDINTDTNELGAMFFPYEEKTIDGDINADGEFSIADAVLLQNWLLNIPNTKLADWQAGDLFSDGRLDIYDLCQMRRMLIRKSNEGGV